MKTLQEALETFGGRNGIYVWRQLSMFGITSFEDCTADRISEWVAHIRAVVAPSTARTYTAVLRATLNRYASTGIVPCDEIDERLRVRAEKSQKVYLTEDELARLEAVEPRTKKERYTKLAFLISCKTGMRISDTSRVSSENVVHGYLTYVSQKTNKEAKVPISDKVIGWIEEINGLGVSPNLANFELGIKRMCEKAGVDEPIKLFRAGREATAPKWQFVTSHTARVTFCTIMAQKGVPVMDICTMAGHSTPVMTERYIIRTAPILNDAARKFIES